jgi:ABC-2 type transport system ATP-binding protein
MLQATGLHKSFAGKPALHDVSFHVAKGEIYGLLGHNGAGKSTSLGIILGMVMPDKGDVTIGGISVRDNRSQALRKVGAIFEAPAFYDYLSGWENLRILMGYSGGFDEKAAREVIERVGLSRRVHSKVRTYSHGMRQRLALAQALLPRPSVLLLDEPTDGLDPEGIREFRQTVLRLKQEWGMTILLNSHLLGEVEQMCDRCVILKEGKKVFDGVLDATSQGKQRYHLLTESIREADIVASRLGATINKKGIVDLPRDLAAPDFVKALVEGGVRIDSWSPEKKSLEEAYLELTGTRRA